MNAYRKWLLQEFKTVEAIAEELRIELLNQNQMAFELLEDTGDKNYTWETILKAAELVVNKVEVKDFSEAIDDELQTNEY